MYLNENQIIEKNEKAKTYWLGDIAGPVSQTLQVWGKYLEAQLPRATKPHPDYHCTMFYNATKSATFEKEWNELTKGVVVKLKSQYIVVGLQGAALNVEPNEIISKWYKVPESMLHITLLVNERFEAKDLGPIMKTSAQIKWIETENPLIFQNKDSTMLKILCETTMLAKPEEIRVATKQMLLKNKSEDLAPAKLMESI